MRLIDADKIDFGKVFIGASGFAKDTREAAQKLIDAQPTAYDVDKVLEQVKEKGTRICCSVKCTENCEDCEHGCLMRGILETVKAGGVNE